MKHDRATALDMSYWRSLGTGLSLVVIDEDEDDEPEPPAPIAIDAEEVNQLVESIRYDGYCDRPSLLSVEEVDPIAAGAQALVDAGWPAAFVFVFDEPWRLFQRIAPVFEALLGRSYRILPTPWARVVSLTDGTLGTQPRRDDPRASAINDDYYPTSITVSVCLTESSPSNGCTYVVPAPLQEDYRAPRPGDPVITPPSIRALPAPIGSVQVWTPNLVHWEGAPSARATIPRVSISLEAQARSYLPLHVPRLDPTSPPSFSQRLRVIALSLQHHRAIAELDDDQDRLANELAALPAELPELAKQLLDSAR